VPVITIEKEGRGGGQESKRIALMNPDLPVEALRDAFVAARAIRRPVIVTSPTGSGKSTRVPLWCAERGRTLVVEPRRVVARALARRVAEESRTRLGEFAGYAVRDDARWNEDTRIVFVTVGVALRLLASGSLDDFDTWILDEFHERRAETDLLLALARSRKEEHRLVILSATLDAAPLARVLGAEVLHAEGRVFPVALEYAPIPQRVNPDIATLPLRLERALASLELTQGVVLAFLPGVGEIHETRSWLEGRIRAELLCLHGQLSAEEQDRALSEPEPGVLRVVLATNVAESALTVPGVVAVIDSGLERRLVREGGIPALTLVPISQSSADQRMGRAGRVCEGRCIRLWARSARLVPRPTPALQVDEPDDWLLPLLSCGKAPEDLPWIDRPLANGLRDARDRLAAAGLWDADPWDPDLPAQGRLTRRGATALELPLSPSLTGFVLSLRDTSAAFDAVRLAATLGAGRPILRGRPSSDQILFRQRLADGGGDAALLAHVLSCDEHDAREAGIALTAWREARDTLARLCDKMDLDPEGWPATFQTESVLRAWTHVFPRSVRTRRGQPGREEYALGGGTAWLLSRDSLAWRETMPELVLVLAFHSGEDRSGKVRTWIDAAAPLTRSDALVLEAGRAEVLDASLVDGSLRCRLRRKAGDIPLGETDALPESRIAMGQILSRCHPDLVALEARLERFWRTRCAQRGHWVAPPGNVLDWLARAETRGLEELGGLEQRLAGSPPAPASADDALLAQQFPELLEALSTRYAITYDGLKGRITLRVIEGAVPASRNLPRLPAWEGWTVALAKR